MLVFFDVANQTIIRSVTSLKFQPNEIIFIEHSRVTIQYLNMFPLFLF